MDSNTLQSDTGERESSDGVSENPKTFSGYRWDYFHSLQDGPYLSRAKLFLASVDWLALVRYATKERNRTPCKLLPNIGLGYNHMVRILEFTDGTRWVARLRLPPLTECVFQKDNLERDETSEFNTISLLRQRTSIPIPEVHSFEPRGDNEVKVPFMLMDCLEGNVGVDLGLEIPTEYNRPFLSELAKIHAQLSTIQLPKIGTILSINNDGTCQQGPMPGLGGPFDTATEFFEVWAAKAKFGMSEERLEAAAGQYAAEICPSISSFPNSIRTLAKKLSVCDKGPFPICHGDFGHNNVIVDDAYHILGVIDWEGAFAAPWEIFGDFLLNLSAVPPPIDAPWNYDDEGNPKSPDLAQTFSDQEFYITAVKQDENNNRGGHRLSEALGDTGRQQLATAMRLYQSGKVGWYSRLTDELISHI